MMIAHIAAWEKVMCLLLGFGISVVVKVMDYYTEKDKENEAQ